jgi:NAD(P)-dependent dehydrogenase (short-subunit alcohol dehydrogenase family)
MDLGVRDRGYVIFGGTRGIGLATASALAAEGANVALVGRDAQRAEEMAVSLEGVHPARVIGLPGDVNIEGEAERIVALAREEFGGLRGLAVTTGLGRRGQQTISDADDSDWGHTFTDVFLGTVHACRAVLPVLVEGGGGAIVTTGAYSVRAPKSYQAPYTSMKAAVVNLTKNIAKSFGPEGVRANCVCPGVTESETLSAMRARVARERGWREDETLERIMTEDWGMRVALGRPGTTAELGDVMAFLLSERASFLTGATINVDGGTDF